MKKSFFLLIHIITIITLHAQTSSTDMVVQMGRGINLGNVFSAPAEGNWSPAATQQYFTDVASAGFTNVRIPTDFFGTRTSGNTSGYATSAGTSGSYTGTSADYIVNSAYLDRIEQVVSWGLSAGLTVILDFHGATLKSEFIYTFNTSKSEYTDPSSAKRAADNEKFRAIWTQIADRFKNYPDDLLFEIINEPYFSMSAAEMNILNTDILAIIRSSGGNNATRNIIVTGGGATSHQAPLQISPSIINSDNHLIATFHYYQPFNFTSSSVDSKDVESWGTAADKNILATEFDQVLTWATANNIPVFLGEFGADNTGGYSYATGDLRVIGSNVTGFADGGPDNASRVEFHRYCAVQAVNRGFAFSAWDSGPASNKTIHKRTDAPSTVNYDINNFSVTSYNPKVTTTSTVVDNSTWVGDVKDALLDVSTVCNNSTQLITNGNFECGYNDNWSLTTLRNAIATFADATTNARTGDVGAEVDVTTAGFYNQVLLKNQVYTGNLAGKTITIGAYAKASTTGQTFKIRVKATVNGANVYGISPVFSLSTAYNTAPFELTYNVPPNTTAIEFQITLGRNTGTYYIDDVEFSIANTPCTYESIDFSNFDANWGIWNDGGSDCRRSRRDAAYASGGTGRCVRLRDNTSTSVMTTNNLALTNYEELTVDFSYYPRNMNAATDDFWLQISTDGGASYTTIEEWNLGDEFVNNQFYTDQVIISAPFSATTKLRFRCDASTNRNWVYIDDVSITGCKSAAAPKSTDHKEEIEALEINDSAAKLSTFKVFPNPVKGFVNIELASSKEKIKNVKIIDLSGNILIDYMSENLNNIKLNTNNLRNGMYLIQVTTNDNEILRHKKIIITN